MTTDKNINKLVKRKRPRETTGSTSRIEVGCGHLYITVAGDNLGIIEVFATLGKAGGCAMSQLEALTRSISLGLRYGIPIDEYVDELQYIRCPSPALDANEAIDKSTEITSCSDAIAKVLIKIQENKNKEG